MPTIQVDFDVFKAITARRSTEDVSENDVLRQIFGLPALDAIHEKGGRHRTGDWVSKGVRFPQGTQARARYKGVLYVAEVKDGALVVNGKRFDSPSSAAMSITNSPVNGWNFWEVKLPGREAWEAMKSLRAD